MSKFVWIIGAVLLASPALADDSFLKLIFNGLGPPVTIGTSPITPADRHHHAKLMTMFAIEGDEIIHDDDPDSPGIQVVTIGTCGFSYCYQDGGDASQDDYVTGVLPPYDPADYPDNDINFHGFVPYVLGDTLPPQSTTLD